MRKKDGKFTKTISKINADKMKRLSDVVCQKPKVIFNLLFCIVCKMYIFKRINTVENGVKFVLMADEIIFKKNKPV